MYGKVALVTGAASGIGRATALALAREGARLVLCDIDEDGVMRTAEQVSETSECLLSRRVDISDRNDVHGFSEEVHSLVPALDILVNNAGVYINGGLLDLSLEDWDWVISTNLWGAIHCAHFFVPRMIKRSMGGHVVNVSSMFGFWVAPNVIGYLTSKFGVFGFSDALHTELRHYGIGVTTVCPGLVNTSLLQNMRFRGSRDPEAARGRLERFYQWRNYGPDRVANAIVNAIRKNRRFAFPSPESRLMAVVVRLCPTMSRIIGHIAAKYMFDPVLPARKEVAPEESPENR